VKIPNPAYYDFDHGGMTVTTGRGKKFKYYKQALYSTLIELQPEVCIEIGTYQFGTAEVFQAYFDKYKKDGILITCDIKKWCDKPSGLNNVKFLQVYPHWYDKYIEEMARAGELLPDWHGQVYDSVYQNITLIRRILGDKEADFTFIDADHRAICLAKDFLMAQRFTKTRGAIMLEDIDSEELYQESAGYYHGVMKRLPYEFYDYTDWGVCTNCALITKFK
jgi:hypothetical protein